ncbi:MAG TPA: ZIP family metal transporter, partial [Candidatus Aphodomonas merdavium]|nr:ZIP family metal transporter [Candidatus Aphodomonas merdavium]
MSMVWWIITVTAIAGIVGTGLGGLIGALVRKDSSGVVSLLLSFAGGVMLAVVCFDLVPTAIRPENATQNYSIFLVIGGIMAGYGVVYLLNRWIDRCTNHELTHHKETDHPKTADALDELIHSDHFEYHQKQGPQQRSELFVAGVIMACAIALHNLPEGIVIGASYAGDAMSGAFTGTGLVMAIIIGLHNIPEGMAVEVPLMTGGMSRTKAVLVTALSGAPTVIGALIGYGLGGIGPLALSLSLSFASGAMLYVVFGELLPEAILMWRSKLPAFASIVGIAAGLV